VLVDVVNSTVGVVLADNIDVDIDDLSLFVAIVVNVVLSIFELSNVEEAVVNCNFVLPSGVDDISPTLVDRWIFVSDIAWLFSIVAADVSVNVVLVLEDIVDDNFWSLIFSVVESE